MTRAFISAPVPSEVAANLRRLDRTQPGIRWTDPDQWHITLQFFECCRIEEVEKRFSQIKANPSIGLLGPQVSLLGRSNVVVPIGGLSDLAYQVQNAMTPQDLMKKQFSFVGHLTLGRLKDATHAELKDTPVTGSFSVNELELIQSVLGTAGPTHTTINRLSLLP